MKKIEISAIYADRNDDGSTCVMWCNPDFDHCAVSYELLAERPNLPKELPWELEEVYREANPGSDGREPTGTVYFRRLSPATGGMERCRVDKAVVSGVGR